MGELDLDTIRHALAVARQQGYGELELAEGGEQFYARLLSDGVPTGQVEEAEADGAEAGDAPRVADVLAPVVGYYRTARPPLEPGNKVEAGAVIAHVHALGLDNDIESPVSGEVVEVLVQPDQPVMYGQLLARVKVEA
ncbi:MAG TPA: biotin/lipoyl-containing protein [Fimbriimonadaceae bacterium]|nr:biotin/lipoyl-containing protein [Fimbriimonadaceae bacterium]